MTTTELSPTINLQRLKKLLRPGTRLLVVSNEFKPHQNGQVRTIVKAGYGRAEVLGPKGHAAHIALPTSGHEDKVRWEADDVISWRMGRDRETVQHRITYRILPA